MLLTRIRQVPMMPTPRRPETLFRQGLQWFARAGVLGCTACLPSLSDAEVTARIAAAQTAAAATGVDGVVADIGPAPTCGNNKPDPNEQCDDDNANVCDGCAACARTLALKVDDANTVVAAAKDVRYAVGPGRDLQWSAWFKAKATGGIQTFLIHSASQGNALNNYEFAMALALQTEGQLLYPTCYVRTLKHGAVPKLDEVEENVVKATSAVQPGTWHHLRCVLSPTSKKLRAVLDDVPNEVALSLSVPPISHGTLIIGGPQIEGTTPYHGLIDEVHVSLAHGKATATQRRIVPNKETIALFHMDEAAGSKQVQDAAAKPLSAFAVAGVSLTFAPSECYGFSKDVPVCTEKSAPWCK